MLILIFCVPQVSSLDRDYWPIEDVEGKRWPESVRSRRRALQQGFLSGVEQKLLDFYPEFESPETVAQVKTICIRAGLPAAL